MRERDFDQQIEELQDVLQREDDLMDVIDANNEEIRKLSERIAKYQLIENQLKKLIGNVMGERTFTGGLAYYGDIDEDQLISALPILTRLILKGVDFDEMLHAVRHHETLKSQWDQLVMSMKLIGNVEINDGTQDPI